LRETFHSCSVIIKMKIACLVDKFPLLSETFILNQITGLIDRGHEVDIYAKRRSDDPKIHEDVEKYHLMSRTFYYGETTGKMPANKIVRVLKAFVLFISHFHKNPKALLRSLNVFKYKKDALNLSILYRIVPFVDRGDYDVVHCHFGPSGILGATLRNLGIFRGSLLATFYGHDISSYVRKCGRHVYAPLFESCDMILCLSEVMRQQLIDLGCSRQKVVVHHLGINTRRFAFSPRVKSPDGRIRLLTLARLVEKKGIEYAIRAVAKVSRRYPDIEYRIAGDGPLRKELEKLIESLGADKYVKLLGWKSQAEVLQLLGDSHIFIVPSITAGDGDQEGTPTVLLEALAQGIPVLSTWHSGIPEVVIDGNTGFLVPERDAEALAEKLVNLLEHPEHWAKLGSAGRRHVEEYYDIDRLNRRLISLYEQLLDLRAKTSLAEIAPSA